MMSTLIALLLGGSKIVYGILATVAAVAGAWTMGKRSGAKEQAQASKIDQLERTASDLQTRNTVTQDVYALGDDDLERLRQQYERSDDDISDDVHRVAGDTDFPEGQVNQGHRTTG